MGQAERLGMGKLQVRPLAAIAETDLSRSVRADADAESNAAGDSILCGL